MPIYEYECLDCGATFELLRPVSRRDDATVCPRCAGQRAERQLSCFVARSGLDSDMMNYASGVADGGPSRSSRSCGGCTASSCAGCR